MSLKKKILFTEFGISSLAGYRGKEGKGWVGVCEMVRDRRNISKRLSHLIGERDICSYC